VSDSPGESRNLGFGRPEQARAAEVRVLAELPHGKGRE
jgi:hypothetical protein